MKNKDYSIVRLLNFILLIMFFFLFRNDKIMSNYYVKIIFHITLIIAFIYTVKDILLKIRVLVIKGDNFKFIKITFYILITLLFVYFLIEEILQLKNILGY